MSLRSLISLSEAQFPCFWGIDIGGTNIKIGLVDHTGQTIRFYSIPTLEPDGAQAAVDRTSATICKLEEELRLSHEQIPQIGLGSPGSMDLSKGLLLEPPNLPNWRCFAIRQAFEQALGRPVTFLNDANAAAYGEFWLGSGRHHNSMILLTLGTGVGGGIIVDDQLINGVNSFGSECGHIIVDSRDDAELCVWGGGRGQLEAYASASGVVRRTRQRLHQGAMSRLAGLLGAGQDELTAKQVFLAATDCDALALEIIDETARWLGIGITTLVHTIDPGMVVLGGAMNFGGKDSPVGQRFLSSIRREFKSRSFGNVFENTAIGFAALGGDAGYLGAAGYARREHLGEMARME